MLILESLSSRCSLTADRLGKFRLHSSVPARGCKGGMVRFLSVRKGEEMAWLCSCGEDVTPLKKADGGLTGECWRKYMERTDIYIEREYMYTHNFYAKEFSSLLNSAKILP